MQRTLIRPGLLVSLGTTITGGVQYSKTTIEPEHTVDDGTRAAWTTTRVIPDKAEYDAAVIARGKARSLITGVCCYGASWLMCPQAREDDLTAAIEQARAVVDAHNATASRSRVELRIIIGRVADNDVQAAQAIGSEIRGLLDAMTDATLRCDPAAIREAANKARAIAGTLTAETQAKVGAAIAEARKVARTLVREIEVNAERAAETAQKISMDAVISAKFAVLDLMPDTTPAPVAAAPVPSFDLDDDDEPAPDFVGPMPQAAATEAFMSASRSFMLDL